MVKKDKEEKKIVRIEILFDQETGGITLNGPLDNKVLCYGLLEAAKEVVRDFMVKQEKKNGH